MSHKRNPRISTDDLSGRSIQHSLVELYETVPWRVTGVVDLMPIG